MEDEDFEALGTGFEVFSLQDDEVSVVIAVARFRADIWKFVYNDESAAEVAYLSLQRDFEGGSYSAQRLRSEFTPNNVVEFLREHLTKTGIVSHIKTAVVEVDAHRGLVLLGGNGEVIRSINIEDINTEFGSIRWQDVGHPQLDRQAVTSPIGITYLSMLKLAADRVHRATVEVRDTESWFLC